MSNQAILKKIEKLEQEFAAFTKPKSVLGKVKIDESILTKAKKAPFDFDIEKFVTKKDLQKTWKRLS